MLTEGAGAVNTLSRSFPFHHLARLGVQWFRRWSLVWLAILSLCASPLGAQEETQGEPESDGLGKQKELAPPASAVPS